MKFLEGAGAAAANGDLFLEAHRLAEMAGILGHAADAAKYNALADQIKNTLNAEFFDPMANVYNNAVSVATARPPTSSR